ncbi:MAG: TRIC cation channel family protein [Campylobacterota bacterium]|nr:TRIC cation channel family protein [Campylobacterota bacterium]
MLFEITEFIGIASFTLSGFYIAIRNRLDILGIFISSFLTALGGGIIRDTIAGVAPISLVTLKPMFIVLFMIALLITLGFHKKQQYDKKPLFVFIDSIGLVSFSIAGALVALEQNFSLSGVIILAFVTAVGGGILRDILINVVPYVLKGGFYGIISILIGIAIYQLNLISYLNFYTILVVFIVSIILRMFAFKQNWELPNIYKTKG